MNKAEMTRLKILRTGFALIYANGYQLTSINDITAKAGITKGAFYYSFKTKDEMGISVINQMIRPMFTDTLGFYLRAEYDPLGSIYELVHHLLMKNETLHVEHGCPASNLIQEMTPWHARFSYALKVVTQEWLQEITDAIETAKNSGLVNPKLDSKQVAMFIISGYWGIRNFGKSANGRSVYLSYLRELKDYLYQLKKI